MSLRDDLLPRASLRIDLRGAPAGTGFVVAPGLVVTCAHVLLPEGPQVPVDAAGLQVVTPGGSVRGVLAVENLWPEEAVDLAVLRVAADDPVCALLRSDVTAGDELQSYGYPSKYPQGVPSTFEVEGAMLGSGWVKVKEGQVQPGLSGSPVLNVRTGAVCGVLKRTRDAGQDLGGYLVPVAKLLELSPALLDANVSFHRADTTWLDALSAEQREAWRNERGGARPATRPARHLVLTVGQDEDRWQVSAALYPEGDDELAPVGADLNTVREKVARLFRSWGARGRLSDGDQIRLLGGILSSALFPGMLGETLRDLLDAGERVLVSLRFESESDLDLMHLPWEHLYLPEDGTRGDVTLATESKAGFARVLAADPELDAAEPEQDRLSVLVVSAEPKGSRDAKDAEQVADAVKRLTRLAGPSVTFDVEQTPRPGTLATRIGDGAYDVVHYVGFGSFSQGVDSLALGGGGLNGLDYYSVDLFKQTLSKRPPKLVVLQLCECLQPVIPADFTMLAPALVRLPVAAAIAFQYPVAASVAAAFNEALYAALAAGKPVDMAVQEGRSQLTFQVEHPRASVSPALFLRRPAEVRLVRAGAAGAATPAPDRSLVMSRP